MAAGQSGLRGLSVHQNVTRASKQGSDSAIHPPHSMGAAAVLGHTSRPETVTPIPAQVLHLQSSCTEQLLLQNCDIFVSIAGTVN